MIIPSEHGLADKTRWGLNMIIPSERGLADKTRWGLNMIIPSVCGLAGKTDKMGVKHDSQNVV